MGAEHEGRTIRYVADVINEDDPLVTEPLDHVAVVDDLVVAVHRRLEDPDHPG